MGMAVGMPQVKGLPAAVDLAKNPLSETHEFRQACSLCYVRTGEFSTPPPRFGLVQVRGEGPPPTSHRAWGVGVRASHRGAQMQEGHVAGQVQAFAR